MSDLGKYKTEKIKICGDEFIVSVHNAHKIHRIMQKIEQIKKENNGFGKINFSVENNKITTITRTETEL